MKWESGVLLQLRTDDLFQQDFNMCVNCFDKEGHPHKMQKLLFDLDDGSLTGDHKETDPQESRQKAAALVRVCQCSDANCRYPSCQKMKRVARHVNNCKRKLSGGCLTCKRLSDWPVFCYHAKHCQEAKCPVPLCLDVKHKLKRQQLQQKLHQTQILKRSIAIMQNRGLPGSVPQPSQGNSNSSGQPSPSALPLTSPHPPQPGIEMKPATGPQVAALPAMQQAPHMVAAAARQQAPHMVAAAARQQAPHMVAAAVNYGKGNPVVSPPTGNPSVMPSQQMQAQSQKPTSQMMPGVPNRMLLGIGGMSSWEGFGCSQPGIQGQPHQPPQSQQMGLRQPNQLIGPGGMSDAIRNPGTPIGPPQGLPAPGPTSSVARPTQALNQLLQTLKSPSSPQQQQQVPHILKSNPQLMAAYIKQRTAQQQQQQQQLMIGEGNIIGPPPTQGQVQQLWYQKQQQQQQHLLAMRQQGQFPPPQAPLYAQRQRVAHPMNFNPHQQNFQGDGAPQFQFQQQQQQLLMQPQLKQQMASPTHPPVSPQQGIMGHPQQPVPSPSPQQLMQQVRSPPPTAAQLVQAVRSPQPIASPRTQPNTPQAQPIPSPRQQPAPSPHYPAQTHSPHPNLSGAATGLTGPDQMTTGNDMMLTQLTNPVSTHPSIASQLQSPVNQDLGLSRDDSDMTHLTPQEQLDKFVANL